MRNALTIDLEDWYHPELVRNRLPADVPAAQIEQSTQVLLDLLRERDMHATVFVVGEVAQRHPRLIEAIAAQGHELGCHTMSHRPLWQMTPDEFRAELSQFARLAHEVVPGLEIVGFRAPTFSLDNRTRWALGILAEFGYHYDSSVFPLRNPLYGVNGGPLLPYRPSMQDVAAADPAGRVVEFPMSVWTWGGLRLPVSGGFYLRALPFAGVQYCLRQINRTRPFAIYVHPWEAYPGTPRLALPVLSRFVTYHNSSTMLSRLQALWDEFSFAPMRTVLEERGDLSRGRAECMNGSPLG
jgi:polysaccharide deacetylase family protein (PEP-CTERM system associated)